MANIELEGFDSYIKQLEALKTNSDKLCKATVYPGARILGDALRKAVDELPTISDAKARANWRTGVPNEALSESQKAGLQESLGITNIRKDRRGMVQASVGFSGYNGVVTRHFPEGQPNAEVARSLEKGTSGIRRDAFVERTLNKIRDDCIAAMQAEADAQIEKIMNNNQG